MKEIDEIEENEDIEEIETITLEKEDGSTEECEILGIIEFENKKYIALLPMDKDEYYVFEAIIPDGDEEHIEIIPIEDEEIFEKVINEFDAEFNDDEDDET